VRFLGRFLRRRNARSSRAEKTTAKCDMCRRTLVCIEHREPLRFDGEELERIREKNFVHCELCFLVKKRFFENLLKNLREPPLLGWDWHVHFATESVKREFPWLEPGLCINHSARTFPREEHLLGGTER